MGGQDQYNGDQGQRQGVEHRNHPPELRVARQITLGPLERHEPFPLRPHEPRMNLLQALLELPPSGVG